MAKEKDYEEACEKKWEEKFEKKFGDKWEGKFENCGKYKKWHKHRDGFMGGGVYFLAFLGAAVYYVQNATSFWMGILGIIQALFWPALLIYKVFTLLKM